MSHRFIALVFALLSASPFTAPFQTWVLTPVQSHDIAGFTSSDGGGHVEGDSAALTVPPLETRIEASALSNPDAGTESSAGLSVPESGVLLGRDHAAPPAPPQWPALRCVVLRV